MYVVPQPITAAVVCACGTRCNVQLEVVAGGANDTHAVEGVDGYFPRDLSILCRCYVR